MPKLSLSNEIEHVANLPALNDGQRLLTPIECLNTNISTPKTDINSSINTLRNDIGYETTKKV